MSEAMNRQIAAQTADVIRDEEQACGGRWCFAEAIDEITDDEFAALIDALGSADDAQLGRLMRRHVVKYVSDVYERRDHEDHQGHPESP